MECRMTWIVFSFICLRTSLFAVFVRPSLAGDEPAASESLPKISCKEWDRCCRACLHRLVRRNILCKFTLHSLHIHIALVRLVLSRKQNLVYCSYRFVESLTGERQHSSPFSLWRTTSAKARLDWSALMLHGKHQWLNVWAVGFSTMTASSRLLVLV